MSTQPIDRTRDDFADIIDKISLKDSPVGIDAQYTHAIIISYLQQISERLAAIESKLG